MAKTLILFAHPAFEKSKANASLLDAVRDLKNVTIHDLYEAYPDFLIDVKHEQALLEEHDRIVLQHPFFWYSTPALVKEWFDLVLQYGWAYGEGGDKLRGKSLLSAITTGGGAGAYCKEGYNRYPIEELLRPIEQTAALCGMKYESPFVLYGALTLSEEERKNKAQNYRELLASE